MNAVDLAKFWSKVEITIGSDCWIWVGALTDKGYGKFWLATGTNRTSRLIRAHRLSYEHFVGTIPDDLEPDHLCRNRACVNWHHVEPVTRRENQLRGVGFVALNVAKTHCPAGHEYSVENTKLDGRKRYCRACLRQRSRHRRGERSKASAAARVTMGET